MDLASGGYNVYTVSVDPATKKLTASAPNGFKFSWSQDTTGNSCWRQLGFQYNTDTSLATSITAPNLIDLVSTSSLHVEVKQSSQTLTSSGEQYRSQLVIPVTASFGNYVVNNPKNSQEQYLIFNTTVNAIDVQIRDSNNLIINNNGGEWEMLLQKV
jgi:hypothetical protein